MFSKSEKGQAIILIVFSIIGLIGLTALTVDGGMAFSDRRHAQGAADSSAWAGGLANARDEDIEDAAYGIAAENGFTDDGVRSDVLVEVTSIPIAPAPLADGSENPCPDGASPNVEITVTITSYVKTFFAPVVGVDQLTNKVQSVTRACGKYVAPIFGGQAIVSLNPGPNCAFDSGESASAKWKISGGGIFSNGCAISKDSSSVTLDPGECVSTVNNDASGFAQASICPGNAKAYTLNDVSLMMPKNPCDGDPGDVGLTPSANQTTFVNGVYCISDLDQFDGKDVILNNATLYVTDMDFNLKFAGGGGFSGTPTVTGEFSSYYMVIAMSDQPCEDFTPQGNVDAQVLEYRGNGSGTLYGTIFAPTACIDFRGNGSGEVNSQLIGYNVTSNGTADVQVEYVADQNRREPQQPTIELVK